MKPLAKTALDLRALLIHAGVLLFVVSSALGSEPSLNSSGAPAPDIILKNGKIYTDKVTGRWTGIFGAQAISIRDGNIASIGSDKALEKEKGTSTKVIDLKGRFVFPGFNDAHAHLLEGGLHLSRLNLTNLEKIEQLQEKLRKFALEHPQKKWIFGHGWDHTAFPGQKYPTRWDLDAVVSERPVLLWHIDHHMAVANSKALEILHISPETPEPSKGAIQKNEKGEVTGMLFEQAAVDYMAKVDVPGIDELKQALLAAQAEMARFGVTSIQGLIRNEDDIRAVKEIWQTKQLHVRYAMWGELEKPREFLALKERYKELPDDWVRFEAVKGFVDGVISSRTAAMLAPYSDAPQDSGEANYTQEKLNELVLAANRAGLPVALHAVGDKAVAMSIIAFSNAKKVLFNSKVRNRIEHMETLPPYIYPKFSENHVIASVQPSHMIYERGSQNYNLARLGAQRMKHTFAWRNLLDAKARMAFGTDWPVMSLNPMIGLFGAVYRQDYDGKLPPGFTNDQRLSMEQAIENYTMGPAYATREDHVKGSLREGKYADLVVLEKDPFKVGPKELLKNAVYLTISGGKIVYDGSLPQIKPAN